LAYSQQGGAFFILGAVPLGLSISSEAWRAHPDDERGRVFSLFPLKIEDCFTAGGFGLSRRYNSGWGKERIKRSQICSFLNPLLFSNQIHMVFRPNLC